MSDRPTVSELRMAAQTAFFAALPKFFDPDDPAIMRAAQGLDALADRLDQEMEALDYAKEELFKATEAREKAEREVERLRDKLQRVRDALKYQTNSEGGLVAEIDDTLRRGNREWRFARRSQEIG